MLRRRVIVLSTLILSAGLALPAATQEASLPGGATSLREAHGDWSVSCAIQTQDGKKRKICALSQELLAENRQRVLAIELQPNNGAATGTLILPFGLALDKGVSFQLDDGQTGATQRFRTCLPAGCLVSIDFDAKTVGALRTAKALQLKAVTDGGQETVLSISLNGFASAFDRTASLMK